MTTQADQLQTPPNLNLSDVEATSLVTLYCRAIESRSPDPILYDDKAVEIVCQLDPLLVDSSDRLAHSLSEYHVNKNLVVHIALRARRYDEYARAFLSRHPGGVVVNLGCGMDTRFFRLDDSQLVLFDLDLPGVIGFKRRFVPENERYRMLAASVFDYTWMDDVARSGRGPALFLAEGVFMYLDPAEVKSLVLELQACFPGSELVCEVVNSLWLSKLFKPMVQSKMRRGAGLGQGAVYQFGVPHSRALEAWNEGIQFLDEWSYFDSNHPKLGWVGWFGRLKLFRHTQWTVHYRLN
jgi:methyltransferase (TIGR00027 family)